MNDTELLVPIRPLAGVEINMSCMHKRMRGTAQATQVLHISNKMSLGAYRGASQKLLLEFPILGACIREHHGNIWFFSGANCWDIPLDYQEVSSWEDAERSIRETVDEPLMQEQSLWRIKVLAVPGENTTKIVMTFHHAILDGHGLSVVGTRFLHYLDHDHLAGSEAVVIRNFPPAINDFLNEKSPVPRATTVTIPYDVVVPLEDRRTAWKSITLNRTLRDQIEARARSKNLQYNSILSAALIKAISDNQLMDDPIEFKSAVSLRVFGDMESATTSSLGCYMGVSSMPQLAQGRSITDIAKAYQVGLIKDSLKSCFAKSHTTFQDVDRVLSGCLESGVFTGGIGITNIGCIFIPRDYHQFQLIDYFTTVNRVGGTYMAVVHRYQFNDTDTIQFVYPEPLTSAATIEQLIQSFYHLVMTYAGHKMSDEDAIESSSSSCA